MVRFLLTLLLITSFFTVAKGADTATAIFDPSVRTLSVRNPDNFMAPDVIRLGTSDRLSVNFDIIGDDRRYIRYRLIHCNADWQPSRLLESEYLDGFNEIEIDDYAFSSNTYVHFVNYDISIPSPDHPILASGNYLLQVFEESDPDEILLQTRFSVTENSSPIAARITTRTDWGFNTDWQQVELSADLSGLPSSNPYQDFVVTVTQNNRPETMRTVFNPLRVENGHAIFEHNPDLVFGAGNEYRRFETVRVDYPGMHIDSVIFGGTNWHAWLTPDQPRAGHPYSYDQTQHGRFMIDEYNSTDPNLGADYVTVHFSLDTGEIPGADVFVDGDFSLHHFDERNRMTYNHTTRRYEAQIPLKQGSYNYQYVVKSRKGESGKNTPDPTPIEGNLHETSNEYLIKVFHRPPGARADRLIGTALIQ